METGYLGNLTKQQKGSLDILKYQIQNSQYAKDILSHPDGDRWILRFLRATMKSKHTDRLFDVEAAFERMLRTYKFRTDYKVDEMIKTIEMNGPAPEGFDIFQKVNPFINLFHPVNGMMYRFDRFATVASNLNVDCLTKTQWITCTAYAIEKILYELRLESKLRGYEISTYSTFVDCSGVSISGITKRRQHISLIGGIASTYYPEMLGKTYLINCPWYFSGVWELVKPFIDKDTQSKIIISGLAKKELREMLPTVLIPKEFGGESENLVLAHPVY